MDYGHEQTDKELKALENRIRKEYGKAVKEAEQKLNDYLKSFDAKDKKMAERLKAGEITKDEYLNWRKKEMATGERWQALRDSLADTYQNANREASNMIQDNAYKAYADNFNFGTFEAERGSNINTAFTLYSRDSVRELVKSNKDILPPPGEKVSRAIKEGKAKRWNRQQVQSVMLQGLLQGESIPKIAKRLSREVGEKNMRSAIRSARTMTTEAENAGRVDSYRRAQDMGIEMKKQWLATLDGRTRHSHRLLDGESVGVDETFSNGLKFPADPDGDPAEIYNCFVGDTLVATDSDIVRSYKHEYKGELVTIETAAGVKFTCTLNHPILTPSGWVRANRLNEGDDICVTFVGDHHLPRRYPNVNHIHSRIDALHEFANKFGRERVSGLRVNFHGDVPATDVEVITHKGLLRDNRNAGEFEEKSKLGFKFSNSTLFSHGTLMEHFRRIGTSAFSFICGACEAFSFFRRSLSHSEIHRLRPIALLDASGMKPVKNNISGYAKFICERLHGAPPVVFADNIIGVNYSTDCTHVYNLQSDNGYYFVNSIISKNGGMYNGIGAIAHNCRCTLIADMSGYENDLSDRRTGKGFTDYETWKHEHEQQEKNGVVNGTDISDTWIRRKDEFDFEIEDVIDAQGFNGLPRVVDEEEFDRLVQEANNGQGFIAQRTYSATSQDVLDNYRDELYHGHWYVDCSTGGAQYGQGMYCAADWFGKLTDGIKTEMSHYIDLGKSRLNRIFTPEEQYNYVVSKIKESKFSESEKADMLYSAKGLYAYALTDANVDYIEAGKVYNRIKGTKADTTLQDLMKEAAVKQVNAVNYTETFTLDKSARVIKSNDVWELKAKTIREFEDRRWEEKQKAKTREEAVAIENKWNKKIDEIDKLDDGSFAVLKGYDAINAEGHGKSGSYTVILNRTKVIIRRPK